MLLTPELFVKYIHNDNAKPLDIGNGNHIHNQKVQFLSFVQHTQYQLTHETMYVSDFQGKATHPVVLCSTVLTLKLLPPGVGNILMDPQIMTVHKLHIKQNQENL